MPSDTIDFFERARSLIEKVEAPGFGLPVPTQLACDITGTRIALSCRVRHSLDEPPERVVMSVDPDSGVLKRVGSDSWTHSWAPAWANDVGMLAVMACSAEEPQEALHVAGDPALASWKRYPVEGTVENPSFSPEGRRLLYILAPLDADPAGMAYDVTKSAADTGAEWEPRVISTDGQARRKVRILDVNTGRSITVPTARYEVWEAAWLDEDIVVMLVSEDSGESGWYEPRVVAVDLSSGELTTRYRPAGMQLGDLCAHQGSIAFIEAIASDRGIVAGEIVVLEGADVRRTAIGDGAATRLNWLPDGSISVLGMRGPRVFLGHIRPGRAEVDEVWTSDATVSGFQPREAHGLADGSHLALVESYTRFPALVHLRDGFEQEVAAFSHPGVTTMSSWSGVQQQVSWRGRDGLDLQGFLVRPAGEGPHPLVVQLHGGPVAAWHNTWGLTMGERYPITNFLVAAGYAVFHPNPRGSSGRGIDFAERVLGDMNGEDAYDIMAGVEHLVDRGVADAGRVGVTGNSYGGLMSAWLITQHPTLAAAIVRSPVTDFRSQHFTSNIPAFDRMFLQADPFDHGGQYDRRSPLSHSAAIRTPTLLIAGAHDRCTPPSQAEELFGALRALEVPSELVIYPREGHGVVGFPETIDHLARILQWFERYLAPDGNHPAPDPV